MHADDASRQTRQARQAKFPSIKKNPPPSNLWKLPSSNNLPLATTFFSSNSSAIYLEAELPQARLKEPLQTRPKETN
jgi:hypothetical protein